MSQPDRREPASKGPQRHAAQDARGAEIILRTPARKIIFFGGLIAFVLLVFALALMGLAGR